jgi:flagellar motor switch protein FliG
MSALAMLHQDQIVDLLQLLGDDITQEVFKHLGDDERKHLESSLKASRATESLDRDRLNLLHEFESYMRFAIENGMTRPRLHQPEEDEEPPPTPSVSLSRHSLEHPLLGLQKLSPYQLGRAMEGEQPRTVAILVSQLPAKICAEVLSTFPEAQRNLVVRDLSKSLPAPPALVDRIARITLQRAAQQPALPPDRRDSIDRLAEVLRELPKKVRMNTLKEIRASDPQTAVNLIRRLYRFEDLLNAEGPLIQQMLSEIDANTLATALFGAPEAIANRIFENLSRRARQSLQEEMQFQSHIPESRVNQAREAIIDVISRLDQDQE